MNKKNVLCNTLTNSFYKFLLSSIKILVIFLCVNLSYSQSSNKLNIKGKTTDVKGNPLPGVSIIVKGTGIGTDSDFDGNYTIKASTGQVLVFSYVGMQTTEKLVALSTTINVSLKEDASVLDEVVVLGYTKRTKNELTGNTVQVEAAEINEMQLTSVDQVLQGKVAGLNIAATSGTPGSTQTIRIRGIGSLNSSNEPLFVIDGVPAGSYLNGSYDFSAGGSSLSSLASLNPDDIESVTVLKDASATAAYGARGANGVIVITTKTGKGNRKTSFSFRTTYGIRNRARLHPKMLTGAQREELFYDAVYNSYGEARGFTREGAQAFYEGQAKNFGWWGGNLPYIAWKADGSTETDWSKVIENKNAASKTYNFSATGGSEKSSFFISLSYTDIEATTIGSDYDRLSGRINYNAKLTEKVKFSSNISVSNTRQSSLDEGSFSTNPNAIGYFVSPLISPYNKDGSYRLEFDSSAYYNPLYLAEKDISKNYYTRAIATSYLEWELMKGLKFKTQINLDYSIASYKSYKNRTLGDWVAEKGYAYASNIRDFGFTTQNSLNYKTKIGVHGIDVLLLQEYQKNEWNRITASGTGFAADDLTNVDQATEDEDAGSFFSDWMQASYLALVNYTYDGKYVVDATYRREGASRFAPGHRFGNFWSIGAAWNIISENFMEDTVFNDLRLRGSYGVSGNNGIGRNEYKDLLSFTADYNGKPAVYAYTRGNDNLTWENSKTLDIGAEFGLFKNRISGSVTYYNKHTTNQLFYTDLPPSTSFTSLRINEGEISNKGVEVELSFNAINTKNLKWNISGNFSKAKGEILKLPIDASGGPLSKDNGYTRLAVDRNPWEWYMRKWAGVNPDNGQGQWYVNGKNGEVTEDYSKAERTYQGSSIIPDFSGGISTRINYKNFFFNASAYLAFGNKVYDTWSSYTQNNGHRGLLQNFNGSANLLKSWKKPGDITDYPKLIAATSSTTAVSTSTRFLYDGDYMRIREMVIGYKMPKEALKNTGIDDISFSLRGTNLFTWVKDKRMEHDPEILNGLISSQSAPPAKSFVFGINVKF
ncbi:SusC/RagA family TonB-linked outer membrane protein [Xanthomarina gelatinilytica]|uniref:SusC/RagA family TonB-linked outer membrane protein n=1 Tax=Xanthomarina gelatinilytica TaxID=1137281 RepID=UPI003AA895F8